MWGNAWGGSLGRTRGEFVGDSWEPVGGTPLASLSGRDGAVSRKNPALLQPLATVRKQPLRCEKKPRACPAACCGKGATGPRGLPFQAISPPPWHQLPPVVRAGAEELLPPVAHYCRHYITSLHITLHHFTSLHIMINSLHIISPAVNSVKCCILPHNRRQYSSLLSFPTHCISGS